MFRSLLIHGAEFSFPWLVGGSFRCFSGDILLGLGSRMATVRGHLPEVHPDTVLGTHRQKTRKTQNFN